MISMSIVGHFFGREGTNYQFLEPFIMNIRTEHFITLIGVLLQCSPVVRVLWCVLLHCSSAVRVLSRVFCCTTALRYVFSHVASCDVIHGPLYACLRAMFGLSVIGILVSIFSSMLVYQLLR